MHARQTIGRPSFQTSPVSFTIIAVTTAIFVAGSFSSQADQWLFQTFAQANFLVEQGDWYRIFSAALLHASLLHIGFNMYALYLFGPRLEQQVGGPAFAALYVAAAGAGGMVAYAFGPIHQVAIGASGAIFGLFGAWMFVAWKMRKTPGGRSMFNQLGVLLAINMALPLFVGGIAWRAHLGGFASGLLIAWLWSAFAVGKPNARAVRTVIAVGVAIAALAITITV
ncbi:MAG: rhomboid family intramembrane serine protease [Acidimicrobiia bacterium]